MYSCERLPKGIGKGLSENTETINRCSEIVRRNFQSAISQKNKYENNFADPRKYLVQISLYEERPRGCMETTLQEKGPTLVKTNKHR